MKAWSNPSMIVHLSSGGGNGLFPANLPLAPIAAGNKYHQSQIYKGGNDGGKLRLKTVLLVR